MLRSEGPGVSSFFINNPEVIISYIEKKVNIPTMNAIFDLVVFILDGIARITGCTYEEINIILFYIIAPFVYIILIDRLFRFHYLKMAFILLLILCLLVIPDLHEFSKWLFIKSQLFLKSFSCIGLSYVQASVIICVVVPLILLLVLIWLIRRHKIRNFLDNF